MTTVHDIAAAVSTAEMVSRELDEDAVGLWKIAWHLRRALPSATATHVQELAEGVLRGLRATSVLVGDLDDFGAFQEWDPDRSIDEVMARWRQLGRDPNIGEVAWLVRRR